MSDDLTAAHQAVTEARGYWDCALACDLDLVRTDKAQNENAHADHLAALHAEVTRTHTAAAIDQALAGVQAVAEEWEAETRLFPQVHIHYGKAAGLLRAAVDAATREARDG